ncbi:MAG: GNAT family protein [Caldilineaceae bacterium]
MNPLLLDLPNQLTTQRLVLRSYQPGDGAAYFKTVRDNRSHLYEFMPPEWLAWQSETDAELWIRYLLAEWQMRRLFLLGMWERETGAYVGETYLANADWQVPCIELGYFLAAAYTGKGYATEAAQAVISFAFEQLQVVRVELQCAADNYASQKVAERCGFQLEGRLRQRGHKKDGTTVDRLWYGLLRAEWQAAFL